MTGTERAAAAIGCKPDCPEHADEIERVAAAISDAVAEEREACARTALAHGLTWSCVDTATEIAGAIRSRSAADKSNR